MFFTDFSYKFIIFYSKQWVLLCVIEKVTTENSLYLETVYSKVKVGNLL